MPNDKPSHSCLRSQEFGELKTKVEDLTDDVGTLKKLVVEGNGNPALSVSVPKLSDAVEKLTPVVERLDNKVDELIEDKALREGYRLGKEKVKKTNRWLIGTLIAFGGLLLTAIALLLKAS